MEAYFEPKHPGSFGSVQTFKRHLDGKYKTKDIRTWLQNKDAYTLHKPVRLNFRRRMTFTIGIDNLWQADLADFSKLSKHNDNNKFLLTCIDVFQNMLGCFRLKQRLAGP